MTKHNGWLRSVVLSSLVFVLAPAEVQARLGDTRKACIARYGDPSNEADENSRVLSFRTKEGFYIKVYFAEDRAVRLEILKTRSSEMVELEDAEIRSFLETNFRGAPWQTQNTKEGRTYNTADMSRTAAYAGGALSIEEAAAARSAGGFAGLGPAAALSEAEADSQLNRAYTFLRRTLSQSGKERLKREQLDWLKRRDAIADSPARSKFIQERIAELESRVGGTVEAEPAAGSTSTTSGSVSEAEADWQLNTAYSALRRSMSEPAKESLKREQHEWLKKRDQISDPVRRARFVQKRAAELERRAAQ